MACMNLTTLRTLWLAHINRLTDMNAMKTHQGWIGGEAFADSFNSSSRGNSPATCCFNLQSTCISRHLFTLEFTVAQPQMPNKSRLACCEVLAWKLRAQLLPCRSWYPLRWMWLGPSARESRISMTLSLLSRMVCAPGDPLKVIYPTMPGFSIVKFGWEERFETI